MYPSSSMIRRSAASVLIEAFEAVAPGVKRCAFAVPGHTTISGAQLIPSLWGAI
jgi:hypothetical protein